jgi:hypothetical protein
LSGTSGAADGVLKDVIAPPTDAEGGLFSETNDNCIAILLSYGRPASCWPATPRRGRSSWRAAPTRGLKRLSRFETTKQAKLKFRALLTEGGVERWELLKV